MTRWSSEKAPEKILIIRFHAVGDVAITLPYSCSFHRQVPEGVIDFLTTEVCADLGRSVTAFSNVLLFPFSKNRWIRLWHTAHWCFRIWRKQYKSIIDLQGNWVSKSLRVAGRPLRWAEFDRFSTKPAGQRVSDTFLRAGFDLHQREFAIDVRKEVVEEARETLVNGGWDGRTKLVMLNPAGLFPTRNWPLEYFALLAHQWLKKENVTFLIVGTERVRTKAAILKKELGSSLIDLTAQTSLAQALGIIQFVSCVISEDSGLMHMAWVSGVPTVAMFGSTRSVWAKPLSPNSLSLSSSDLECGDCESSVCKFGDVHCLTRYSPSFVLDKAVHLSGHYTPPEFL